MTQGQGRMIVDKQKVKMFLGDDAMRLIETIATSAQARDLSLYLVGGIVRDLLLNRPNYDIDFVLEGDAIEFSTALQAQFGGDVRPYPPFKTATWYLDNESARVLGISQADVPDYLDFVSARTEIYEHPAALPTVFMSDIQHDLFRRDFTINTLAIQLSPLSAQWQLLDRYSGVTDLNDGVIRVLHDLSFIDDPTRIFRAIRFSERLKFTIEPNTDQLMQTALSTIEGVTGERLQNEINLILQEESSVQALRTLNDRGVLVMLHPDFKLTEATLSVFNQRVDQVYPQWDAESLSLSWHILLGMLPPETVLAITDRLLIGQNRKLALLKTATLMQSSDVLADPESKPSEIVAYLADVPVEALTALWLYHADAIVRERIETYYEKWQHIKPSVDGHALKKMGLKPSPLFREILTRLKIAWLDGLIYNEAQEQALLNKIIQEVSHERPD